MKRNILSLAVAATVAGGAVGTANAMYVNDKGLGEALVYPFYSAASGNDTYISVVNTTMQTKAVKVRFIEALDSQEVLDFNLYLSPNDVWAGVITANPNGDGAIIRTADTSCTVPELGTAGGANTVSWAVHRPSLLMVVSSVISLSYRSTSATTMTSGQRAYSGRLRRDLRDGSDGSGRRWFR
jgi:hypothetical protein